MLTSDVTASLEVFGVASKKAWFSNYQVLLIAATQDKTITTKEGLTLVANNSIYDAPQLDVLLVVSAYPQIKVQYDQNVVVDKDLITSNGGPESYQAAFALLARLSSEKYADEIAESIQFNRLKTAFLK